MRAVMSRMRAASSFGKGIILSPMTGSGPDQQPRPSRIMPGRGRSILAAGKRDGIVSISWPGCGLAFLVVRALRVIRFLRRRRSRFDRQSQLSENLRRRTELLWRAQRDEQLGVLMILQLRPGVLA